MQSKFNLWGSKYDYQYDHTCKFKITETILKNCDHLDCDYDAYDKCASCRWRYNANFTETIGQFCVNLFDTMTKMHWRWYRYTISETDLDSDDNSTISNYTSYNNHMQYIYDGDILFSLIKRFTCTFIKLFKSIEKYENINPSNYTTIKNYKHVKEFVDPHSHDHDHPYIGSDADFDFLQQLIHRDFNITAYTVGIMLFLLSLHYLVTQERNEQTLKHALLAAHWSTKYSQLRAKRTQKDCIGDKDGDIIECCIYFICQNWVKYDQTIEHIRSSFGEDSNIFHLCCQLRTRLPCCSNKHCSLKNRISDNGDDNRIFTNVQCPAADNCYNKMSLETDENMHMDEWLAYNKRWDMALNVILIGAVTTSVQGPHIHRESSLRYQQSRCMYMLTNGGVKNKTNIQFLSNLCQLKQCHWKKCKKKDIKLQKCKKCKKVMYCSKLCQKKHWINGHRHDCIVCN